MSNNESDSEDEYTSNEIVHYFPITSPDTSCNSLNEAIQHDQKHDFNLLDFLPPPDDEEFYEETIIIVNKCRSFVMKNSNSNNEDKKDLVNRLKEYLKCKRDKGDEEEFFRPVLQDDAMLMYIDDLEDMKASAQLGGSESEPETSKQSAEEVDSSLQIQTLKEQLRIASSHISKLTALLGRDDDDKDLKRHIRSPAVGPDNDTYYFSSYSHSSIHETMLRDKIRTEAYQNAILKNPHMFKDKIIMDIGCGTGILSLFAAKAGAKKVISIDASDMYSEAAEIVRLNGYDDVIHVVHGKVEDLIKDNALPLEEGELVDCVISEWMGYALFFETMLPSVMVVRDKLMDRKSGTMWPNRSMVYLEGATDSRLDYWSDVYGFKMDVMKNRVTRELRKDAGVEIVDAEDIVTTREEIVVHDLNTCRDEELDFEVPFELKGMCKIGEKKIDKLVVSFDIEFDIPGSTPTKFSTGCQSEPTHWKQATIWFDPKEAAIILGTNEVLKGTFRMSRNDINQRDMDFLVRYEVGSYSNNENAAVSFEKRMEGTIITTLGSS